MAKPPALAAVPNAILASLPKASYRSLAPHLSPVALAFGEVLYQAGGRIAHIYFPTAGLVSLVTLLGDTPLEVGMIGREGMVGTSLALGVPVSPVRALVQGAGQAMSMTAGAFQRELGRNPALRTMVHRHVHLLMMQITQTAACNRFHAVEARLARWLLMTRDRLVSPEFPMTQEFLSTMLGVRRVGITEAASRLQQRRVIRYVRGKINIINEHALETAACPCYARLRKMESALEGSRSRHTSAR